MNKIFIIIILILLFFNCSKEIYNNNNLNIDLKIPSDIKSIPSLAMVLTPDHSDKPSSWDAFNVWVDKAFNEAKIDRAYSYYDWKSIQPEKNGGYFWNETDLFFNYFKEKNYKSAIVINLMNVFTGEIENIPNDLKFSTFTDPEFLDLYGKFLDQFLDRYNDLIEYFYLSNEIDTYLAKKDNLTLIQYCKMLDKIVLQLEGKYPKVKIGTVSTFHSSYNQGTLKIAEELAKYVKVIGFSLYHINNIEKYFGEPEDIKEWLPVIKKTVGTTHFAIVETAWPSDKQYGGSLNMQVRYINQLFKMKDYFGDQLEYVCWFSECDLYLKEFEGSSIEWGKYTGLISYEGIERPVWKKWVELVNKYK